MDKLEKLLDERFEVLLNIGFTVDEINESLDIFCEGYIDDADSKHLNGLTYPILALKFRCWLTEVFDLWNPHDEKTIVMHADVLRRSGSFDEVLKRYSNFSSSEELHNEIIQFQLKLSEQKNINAYSIDRMRYETC